MTSPQIIEALKRLITAAEDVNAAWKANPETVGTEDRGVAALMAVQTSVEQAKAALRVMEKQKPRK
jgi:hypothetical protein